MNQIAQRQERRVRTVRRVVAAFAGAAEFLDPADNGADAGIGGATVVVAAVFLPRKGTTGAGASGRVISCAAACALAWSSASSRATQSSRKASISSTGAECCAAVASTTGGSARSRTPSRSSSASTRGPRSRR
ncbi:hypothetical protein ACFSTD_07290 [Novosphingobium colocasiae]